MRIPNPTPDGRSPYKPRPDYKPKICPNCGLQASIAFNVVVRTLGRGRRAARKLKMTPAVPLCAVCSKDVETVGHWTSPDAVNVVLFLEEKKEA